MVIGQLKQVVRFDKNIPTPLGAGFADVYTTLLTTRGHLKKVSGQRANSFGDVEHVDRFDLYVRYQTDLDENLRTDTKIVIDEKTYTIQTYERVGEKSFYYHFVLVKKDTVYATDGTPGNTILADEPLYLSGVAGETSVSDDLLISVSRIYLVMREGVGYTKVTTAPSGRQFRYVSATGEIEFDSTIPFNAGEKIYVLYKG